MTAEYGRYAPMAPRTMSQNRNSAIASPRTRTSAGTNAGIPNQMESSVRKSMNVPTPTAPGGHRQIPYGGRTEAKSQNLYSASGNGRSPVNTNEGATSTQQSGPVAQSESRSPQNPIIQDALQNQLATMNRIQNRGEFGMPIPKGNPQGVKPMGIYNRPSQGRRY